MLVSLALIGWLFFAVVNYVDAGFDCADRTAAWETCAEAVRVPIAVKSAVVLALWGVSLWLLIRERKKQ
ncbi:MAG TPA: hypothetical protein VFT73_12985 [Sphingomonas sp.]|nr:hypothetical protein [Sphingomonas sp.]